MTADNIRSCMKLFLVIYKGSEILVEVAVIGLGAPEIEIDC